MKIIKQTLYSVALSKPKAQWQEIFFVEANNFDEAVSIAKEVLKQYYEEWNIQCVKSHEPLFKPTAKTITVEL